MLYDSPIVQNLGLFLQGVDKPVPSINSQHPSTGADDDEITDNTPVPYHKQALLNLVTNLHIVHASSSVPLPVDDCYLVMPTYERRTLVSLEECRADRLGKMDLDGYVLADDIMRRMEPRHPSFDRLKTLALGAWDDGRWHIYAINQTKAALDDTDPSAYQTAISEVGTDEGSALAFFFETHEFIRLDTTVGRMDRSACPISRVEDILYRAFYSDRSVTACTRSNTVLETERMPNFDLMIRHGYQLPDSFHDSPGRYYVTSQSFQAGDGVDDAASCVRFAGLHLRRDNLAKPVFTIDTTLASFTSLEEHFWSMRDVELCIAPMIPGDEGQLRLSEAIKDAAQSFRQRDKTTREHADRYWKNFRILVGDEIPACPCCGSRNQGVISLAEYRMLRARCTVCLEGIAVYAKVLFMQ